MNKYIILQANNYFYLRGGSERYYFSLMDLLAQNGHDVVPFSTKNPKNTPTSYGDYFAGSFDPDELPSLGFARKAKAAARMIYSLEAKKGLSNLLKTVRPHLAHCHNIYGALSPSILSEFKKNGLPVVLTAHDLKILCPNHRMFVEGAVCERCKGKKFYECVIHKCMGGSRSASVVGCLELYIHRLFGLYERNVDLIVAPSEFFKNKLIDYGLPAEKIVRIPNFVDVQKYAPNYENEGYFIYFGRLEESKGLGTILDAAVVLRDVNFVIVGGGPMEGELRERVGRQRLDNVKLAGQKGGGELIDLIRAARASIVPSRQYENSPYAIFESYACGKAVIGSAIGGIPELIEDGKTGFLFKPSDAGDLAAKIKLMIQDGALAGEMGRNARQRVEEKYGPGRHYENIISVYRRLL